MTPIDFDLDDIPVSCFSGFRVGLEKEGLRILNNGQLCTSNHPETLGSALTHQTITTDFSESQLELVTPPCWSSENALTNLHKLQTFVHQELPRDELIWTASMPGMINCDDEIRIAEYGNSKSGIMKTVYRRGLAQRYGKKMQLISGIHFNYSFADELWPVLQSLHKNQQTLSDFTSEHYMSTVRNIQRYDWLLLYLFGASPAVSKTFCNKGEALDSFDKHTYFNQHATSLRMSDIGYTNKWRPQNENVISHQSLDSYIRSLTTAINTPNLEYQRTGLYDNGQQIQLNTNELQIENEYYSSVRPKQIPHNGETYLDALQNRGVRYLEIRSIDINPFCSTGIDLKQLHFTEVFVNFCLFKKSKISTKTSDATNRSNLNKTAFFGRNPSIKLIKDNKEIYLKYWAEELFTEMHTVAKKLDSTHRENVYSQALDYYKEMCRHPDQTLSAQVLEEMRNNKESYTGFVLRKSHENHQYHLNTTMTEEELEFNKALTRQSLRQFESLEKTRENKVQSST